jgi:hypothetical protein
MRIAINEKQDRLVALVRHMHANGLSMSDIVYELRTMGVVLLRGEPLRLVHVWNILRAAAF